MTISDCIEFPRGRDGRGYGAVWFNGKMWGAHRLAFLWSTGIHPGELHVCHKCDNPPCCNPEHLFLGSSLDNHRDMDTKGRRVSVNGERHGGAKLTYEEVRQVRCLLALGITQREIAKLFGVSQQAVSLIARGRVWGEGKMRGQPLHFQPIVNEQESS